MSSGHFCFRIGVVNDVLLTQLLILVSLVLKITLGLHVSLPGVYRINFIMLCGLHVATLTTLLRIHSRPQNLGIMARLFMLILSLHVSYNLAALQERTTFGQ